MYQYILLHRGKIRFADGKSFVLPVELTHHCILFRRTLHESDMKKKNAEPCEETQDLLNRRFWFWFSGTLCEGPFPFKNCILLKKVFLETGPRIIVLSTQRRTSDVTEINKSDPRYYFR